MSVSMFLVIIALLLTIASFFTSKWPLVTVAVLLVCVAMLAGSAGTIHLGLVG